MSRLFFNFISRPGWRIPAFQLVVICVIATASNSFSQTNLRDQTAVTSKPRTRISLNQDWKFLPKEVKQAESFQFQDSQWTTVNLPHTWNAEDTQDDAPGYRQGVSWYRKTLNLDDSLKRKRVFLYFEGANQVAEVFVNGLSVGRHVGGYSAFAFDVTDLLRLSGAESRNVIAVRVDNTVNANIPPAPSADFNLYGGIYRDVWLVVTEPVHVTMLDRGSPGFFIDTPSVSDQTAIVRVRGKIRNDTNEAKRVRVLATVSDSAGRTIAASESIVTLRAGEEGSFQQTTNPIRQPKLWSPESPNLYPVKIDLYEANRVVDRVESNVGFRWFSFDAAKGFSLNGKAYKLHGVNRHQDYKGIGNAVPNERQVADLELIKGMGFNCVLLAHYPQDPVVLETADRLGLIVWEEVPIVREISTSAEFTNNCKQMLTEMIRQHYNHPSVVMWCYMNEIFLRMVNEPGYVNKVVALAKTLDALARAEDPGRFTVIASNRSSRPPDVYSESGLLDIPQIVGLHMYFGWYYGKVEDLGQYLDDQHKRYPTRKLFVSEYGADSDSRLHSQNGTPRDSSTEYALTYHKSYLQQLDARPYLSGIAIWNGFDFGSESRGESLPHMNLKGLFTFDRKPKDVGYFYRANFSSDPVVYVATRDQTILTGSGKESAINVFTNLESVELFLNGKLMGRKSPDALHHLSWSFPFQSGLNVIEARGRRGSQTISDRVEVRFIPRSVMTQFDQLAVNVGSSAQYIAGDTVWEPDQPYQSGGWGYDGGKEDKTDKNVLGTDDDPLYRTFRKGVTSYRFDVPDGTYDVELRFIEPQLNKPGQRVFDITTAGKILFDKLDLAKEVGPLRSLSRTVRVQAGDNKGVELQFKAESGEVVVSGIRIRRVP
jgi:beta-galactosidase